MIDLKVEIVNRYKRLQRAEQDLQYRDLVIERCKRDPIYWFNNWVWTSDPRNSARYLPVNLPFVLWDKQEEYIRWRRNCILDRKFGIIGKSRDSGISWLNAGDHTHYLLFGSNYKGALGSRKEMLVDRLGDPDALFQKVRFILDFLPFWMKPKNLFDGYMRIINKDRNNVLTGEAGDSIGRGGRNLLYDVDEFAFLESQQLVLASLSNNADTVILTSTPNGNSNEFAKIFLGDNKGYRRFTFHWKEDPRKNTWVHPDGRTGKGYDCPIGAIYPWYEQQKDKLDELTLAQEIDIDFSASMEGICIPAKWVEAAIDFPLVMSNYRLQAGLDVATEGSNLNVFTVVDGGNKVTFIDSWNGLNTTETAFKVRDICHSMGIHKLNFDGDGVGAGVAGTLQTTSGLRFQFQAMHGGSSPSNYYWTAENKSSKDKFVNRRAELWYLARERFRKTYEMRNGIREYPLDDCISIPNDRRLITQLSLPLMKYRDNGKMLLESKNDMRKRGASSPDFADSMVYALANDTNPTFVQNIVQW